MPEQLKGFGCCFERTKVRLVINKLIIRAGNYLSLVKFSHTLFALPFALMGFALASVQHSSHIDIKLLLLVLACMFFARNAAMSFNRWADRLIDAENPRTSSREIPAKIIKPSRALAFCIGNAFLFVLSAYFINPLCFYLSPIALLIILGYSYTKRFTPLSHFVLGLGLGLAPTGAYLAVTGVFDLVPVFISLAVWTWVTGFDIIYALQDTDFDENHHLRSIPVAIGKKRALQLSLLLHFVSACFLVLAGFSGHFRTFYWIGLVIFCIMLFYQHTLVSADNLKKVNLAFFTFNGIASIVFACFAITDFVI